MILDTEIFRNKPGIYKITNLTNGKIYIGQSIRVRGRIREHIGNRKGQLITSAIKKYGKENFKFEVLIYCEKEFLDNLEIYFIKENNCLVPNGYNIQRGGQNNIHIKKSRKTNTWLNKNLPKETRNKMAESNSGENNSQSKEVEDITGRIWKCLRDCAKELDVRLSALSSMLNSNPTYLPHLHYLDLHFVMNRPENYEYKTMEEIEHLKIPKKVMIYKKPKSERKPNSKERRIISADGKVWNSVSDCAREFNLPVASLSRMLKGFRSHVEEIRHLGLRYENPEYMKKEMVKPRKPKQQKRTVRRSIIDNTGRIYKSIRECAKIYNVPENHLGYCLNGKEPMYKKLEHLELRFIETYYKPKDWKSPESKASKTKGIPRSKETRTKLSIKMSGDNNPKCIKIIDKNRKIYNSIKSASKELNISNYTLGQMLLGHKEFPDELKELELKYLENSLDNSN